MGHTLARQVVRGGAQIPSYIGDTLGNQRGLLELSDTDGHIQALGDDIPVSVVQMQQYPQLRVKLHELGQDWSQATDAE